MQPCITTADSIYSNYAMGVILHMQGMSCLTEVYPLRVLFNFFFQLNNLH